MFAKQKTTNQGLKHAIPALLLIIIMAIFFSACAPAPQAVSNNSAVLIPNTGGMSQRTINAYSERLSAQASQPVGMSDRALDAYSARMTGLAGKRQLGMSRRALEADTARWNAMARYYSRQMEK